MRHPGPQQTDPRSPLRLYLLVVALSAPLWLISALIEPPSWMPMGMPAGALMFICPLIAVVILVRRDEGWAGVRRLLRRTLDHHRIARKRWYLPAILMMPALALLSYPVMIAMGRRLPDLGFPPLALLAIVVAFLTSAAAEELAWTGYAAGPLQKRWGALGAAIILGVGWAAWHVVPWSQTHDATWVTWQALSTVTLRVLIFWIFSNTGGSVLATILFHAMVNISTTVLLADGASYDPAIAASLQAAAAAVVVLWWGPSTLARFRFRTAWPYPQRRGPAAGPPRLPDSAAQASSN